MKQFLFFLLIATLFLFGCSESDDDNNNGNQTPTAPELSEVYDMQMVIPDSLAGFTAENVNYEGVDVTGYALEQFLNFDRDEEDGCQYLYEVVSNEDDGLWTARSKDDYEGDLSYEKFISGYLLPDEKHRTFYPDEAIPGMYNTKWAKYINLYRYITVVKPDGTEILFETGAFETSTINYLDTDDAQTPEDPTPGFTLNNFISDYVLGSTSLEDFDYNFVAADIDDETNDNYQSLYTSEELAKGYWLTEKNRAIFIDDTGAQIAKKFKKLIKIELVEKQ